MTIPTRKRKKPVETASEQIARWQQPGAEGFLSWLADTKPRVPSSRDGFCEFELTPELETEVWKMLSGKFRTVVVSWPRRHGKTTLVALIIVWRFLTRRTQMIAVLANSAVQSIDTGFRLVSIILRETPYTAAMLTQGTIRILGDAIHYDAAGNTIQGFPSNAAALYGKKITIGQITELHAAKSQGVYDAVASATIDSEDGLVLCDSTVGPRSSPLYGLYQLSQKKADPSLYFSYISYQNLQEAVAKSPHWISTKGLKSRAAQMLPLEFAQQHLNLWGSASNSLFTKEIIETCTDKTYPFDAKAIAGEAAHSVGCGLDRAYGFSLHGDATVSACVLKTIRDDQEHYFVLACDKIAFSAASGIKNAFTKYHTNFGMERVSIESTNTQDIAGWCDHQEFEHEIVHATGPRQASIFTALYGAASEGRLHIHPSFKRLLSEMETFEYSIRADTQTGQSIPKFEHARGCHDDSVYALAWAVYSMRQIELNAYEIPGIFCNAEKLTASMCVLNGGAHRPLCSSECRSFIAVEKMYAEFVRIGNNEQVDYDFFVNNKLKNTGAHVVPR